MQRPDSGKCCPYAIECDIEIAGWDELLRKSDVRQDLAAKPESLCFTLREGRTQLNGTF
jgi:hypothetical protein